MDRLYIAAITLHLSIFAKKRFYCNDLTIREFGIIDSKNSSTAYVILYELIDTWFLDSNRRVGVWSLPWPWHIISIPLATGRGTGAETCGLDDVFPPDDLCSRPEALCCDAWCRGLTTCLLHVGPPFGNRFLNTSWAVGLTYWIVYLHFLYFDICNYICLDTSYHFGYPTKMLSRLIPGCQLQHRNRKKKLGALKSRRRQKNFPIVWNINSGFFTTNKIASCMEKI